MKTRRVRVRRRTYSRYERDSALMLGYAAGFSAAQYKSKNAPEMIDIYLQLLRGERTMIPKNLQPKIKRVKELNK